MKELKDMTLEELLEEFADEAYEHIASGGNCNEFESFEQEILSRFAKLEKMVGLMADTMDGIVKIPNSKYQTTTSASNSEDPKWLKIGGYSTEQITSILRRKQMKVERNGITIETNKCKQCNDGQIIISLKGWVDKTGRINVEGFFINRFEQFLEGLPNE